MAQDCNQGIFGTGLSASIQPLRTTLRLLIAVLSQDRKSTRLNSSHSQISYAVFCLKKKKKQIKNQESQYEDQANNLEKYEKDINVIDHIKQNNGFIKIKTIGCTLASKHVHHLEILR